MALGVRFFEVQKIWPSLRVDIKLPNVDAISKSESGVSESQADSQLGRKTDTDCGAGSEEIAKGSRGHSEVFESQGTP